MGCGCPQNKPALPLPHLFQGGKRRQPHQQVQEGLRRSLQAHTPVAPRETACSRPGEEGGGRLPGQLGQAQGHGQKPGEERGCGTGLPPL